MLDSEYSLLVGSYSDIDALAHQPHAPTAGTGIYVMTLRQDLQLSNVREEPALNPAVLLPHPSKPSLYAIVETIQEKGTVLRYEAASGDIEYKDSFTASGLSTCYLAVAPQEDAAIIINYWDAIIDVVDMNADGSLGDVLQSFKQFYRPEDQWRQVTDREDHWGNRQVGPHAHCAHFWNEWVFIPDLGENAVFQYRYDPATKRLTPETHIEFEAGSGPRHMAMHPTLDLCYVSNELFNTVCVAELDSSDPDQVKPRLNPVQYESTVHDRESESYVSEIKLSPDANFLYVSNRGDDSLAVFKVRDNGKLDLLELVSTGGKFPRHFSITPDGKAVIVANQDSSELRVFSRSVETGLLTDTGHVYQVPAPNYIRFL